MTDVSAFVNQLQSVLQGTVGSSANPVIVPSAAPAVSAAPVAVSAAPQKTIKIMIVSTHTNQMNGYSKVVHNLIQQLSTHPWISIVHFGTQKMMNADLGRLYPSSV